MLSFKKFLMTASFFMATGLIFVEPGSSNSKFLQTLAKQLVQKLEEPKPKLNKPLLANMHAI